MLLGTNPKNWVSRILGRQSNSPNYQTPPAPANPVSDAETLLSDDPNTWTRVLERFLERSSPEGYAFARDQGRLDWHLQRLTAWGQEQWQNIVVDSAEEQRWQRAAINRLCGNGTYAVILRRLFSLCLSWWIEDLSMKKLALTIRVCCICCDSLHCCLFSREAQSVR